MVPDFERDHNNSDVVFVIEGKRLYAHRLILSQWSPVFKAMFESEFLEREAAEIHLPQKSCQEVVDLLQYLYPPCADVIDDANVRHLLKLADEYQIMVLKKRCLVYLNSAIGPQNAVEFLYLSALYSDLMLRNKCLEMVSKLALEDIERSEYFPKLSSETVEIIHRKRIQLLEEAIGFVCDRVLRSSECFCFKDSCKTCKMNDDIERRNKDVLQRIPPEACVGIHPDSIEIKEEN